MVLGEHRTWTWPGPGVVPGGSGERSMCKLSAGGWRGDQVQIWGREAVNQAGGRVNAKALRWNHAWCVGRTAGRRGVARAKEGGKPGGGEGVGRALRWGQYLPSVIAVLTLGPSCHCPHLKLERLRLWVDEVEQGFRPRWAQGQTTYRFAVWPWLYSAVQWR